MSRWIERVRRLFCSRVPTEPFLTVPDDIKRAQFEMNEAVRSLSARVDVIERDQRTLSDLVRSMHGGTG